MADYDLPVLCLSADLIRQVELRRRFDAQPFQVMAAYGLDNAAMEAFYTMFSARPGTTNPASWKAIVNYIWHKEIKTFSVDRLDPQPSDPDCQLTTRYPNPKLLVHYVHPPTGPGGGMAPVTIKGQGFWKTVDVYLVKGGSRHLVLAGGTPVGTFRCSHLTNVSLNLTGVTPGNYDLVVRNPVSTPHEREYQYTTVPFVVT